MASQPLANVEAGFFLPERILSGLPVWHRCLVVCSITRCL